MADANLQVKITAEDAFSGVFANFGSSLGNIASAATSPIRALGGIVDAVGKIGLAINGIKAISEAAQGAGNAIGIGLVSEMEQTTAKFVAFTGSSEEAARLLKVVRAEADATPFSFKELANATASLLPASKQSGVALMDLTKVAETLGALNPAQGLEGAAIALRAAVGGDFTSIIERFDLPRERMNELKKQGVPAVEAVTIALKELGIDGGLVAGMANTLSGRWSTFNDTIDGFKTSIAQPIFNQLKIGLENIGGLISDNREYFDDWANSLGAAIGEAGQEFNTFLVTVSNIKNVEGVDTFTAVITALELRIGEVFGPTAQGIFHSFVDLLNIVWDAGKRVFEGIKLIVEQVMADFGGSLTDAEGNAITFKDVIDQLGIAVEAAGKMFLDFSKWMTGSTPGAEAFRAVLVAVVAGFIAFQVVSTVAALIQGVTGAFAALNAVMVANPIGATVVVLAALAAGLIYAYKHSETFRTVVDAAFKVVSEAVQTGLQFALAAIAAFVDYFNGLPDGLGAKALAIALAIVQGIGKGLNAFGNLAIDAIKALAVGIIDTAKKVLGIASPSAEMQAIGEYVVEGLTIGIEETASQAVDAVSNLAEAIGAAMPVILTLTEQEMAKYQKQVLSLQDAHQREVQDAERKHQIKVSDLQAEYAAADKDKKKAVLQKIQDDTVAYQRQVEESELAFNRRMEDLNQTHADAMIASEQRMAEQRGQALNTLMTGMAEVESATAAQLNQVGERVGERINAAISSAASAIQDASAKAAEQIASAEASIELSREIRGRRAEFSSGQSAAADARKRAQEDSDIQSKAAESASTLAAKSAKDLTSLTKKQAGDKADAEAKITADSLALKQKREREDSDGSYKLAQDLRYAKDDADRNRLREAYARMVDDRTRQRALDDKAKTDDINAARRALDAKQILDRQALADKQADDIAALAAQTARSIADLAARRQREDDDRIFRQGQQVAAQEFSDGLENEALTRQIERIKTERDNRIDGINNALTEKRLAIAEDAKTEIAKIIETSATRIAKLKTEFFDKVGPLTDEAKGKILGYIGDVQKRVGELQAAAVAAAAAVASVGGGGSNNGVASGLSDALVTLVTQTRNAGSFDRGINGRGGAAEGARSMVGGNWLVGERGPEILQVPGGSNVFNNNETRSMVGGGDDTRPVIINLDGQTIARSTWKHLKRLNLSGATLGLN
jgi:hypothetical protein